MEKKEQKKLEELKAKITNAHELSIPRPHGEVVLITDASDEEGGATIFQWQRDPNKSHNYWCKTGWNLSTQLPRKFQIGPPWSFQWEME